jgi:hypothetical protein
MLKVTRRRATSAYRGQTQNSGVAHTSDRCVETLRPLMILSSLRLSTSVNDGCSVLCEYVACINEIPESVREALNWFGIGSVVKGLQDR